MSTTNQDRDRSSSSVDLCPAFLGQQEKAALSRLICLGAHSSAIFFLPEVALEPGVSTNRQQKDKQSGCFEQIQR